MGTPPSHGSWPETELDEAQRALHKDIYAVVEWAVNEKDYRLRKQGHGFYLYCPCGQRDLGMVRVDHTPRNPTWVAKKIKHAVARCPGHAAAA
jgi:hypothetical protein